jgi:signal transduction histidine kinase/ligand-binding sensor domain-containing protein
MGFTGTINVTLQANYSHRVLRRLVLILSSILFWLTALTQRHNFISYNIDEGLPQSAVVNFLQDNDHHIWAATAGGISRFDGKKFTNYTTDEGLSENNIMQITIDHHQRIWASTNSGLNLINNNKVSVFSFPEKIRNNRVRLVTDKTNKLWCMINGTIYSFNGNSFIKEELKGLVNYDFSLFFKDKQEDIYLLTAKKQLYKSEAGNWKLFASLDVIDSTKRIFQVYIDSSQNAFILTSTEIFLKHAASNELISYFKSPGNEIVFRCMNFDRSGNLWIGCVKGVFKIKPGGITEYFTYKNGFTDNWVNQIFPDVEGNVWLGTEGSGMFKYTGGMFTSFDIASGYFPNGIFAVGRYDKNKVMLGYSGEDFCIYDGKSFTYPLRNTEAGSLKYIYNAYLDQDGVLWIGTIGSGLWKYKSGKASHPDLPYRTIIGVYGDKDRILFATGSGLLIYQKGEFNKVDAVNQIVRSVIPINEDSILLATSSELILLKDQQIQKQSFPKDFNTSVVATLEKRNNKIFIGTLGAGIFVWNRQDGSFTKFTRKNGLNSDFIYSLRFDHKDQLWAGTGKGVSRLSSTNDFTTVTIRNYGKEQGFTGLECNQGAITVMDDNSVWFGAVRGAYCYHPDEDKENITEPKLVLQSVKLFSKPLLPGMFSDSTSHSAFYPVPKNLILTSKNNHITFEFNAITYQNADIRYSYFLKGLEKEYSEPNQTNFVVYPSLPPGSYTFNVKLSDETGKQLGQPVEYKFTIKPAFYQTTWFKVLAVVLLLGAVVLVYSLRKKYRARRERLIQKLRMEEQNKIRVKTAQDFHDEMGNKLARITVLSDILKSKLPTNDEAQGIAKKIQDNASLLYQGTKDIIWSLNPRNDNLYFLVMHINDFAVDLFHETDIEFESMEVSKEFREYFLPMDYARNIMMICKETLTNILKHSHASKATIETTLLNGEMIKLTIADNGKGFNAKEIEYGNGLHNIRQRSEYLEAKMEICSNESTGTRISLTIAIPSNEGARNFEE